ncbi:alpha/beta hydrolase [Saccharobesus litoralis]|uniref:Alpha/beta hydrolase n=1 Tax=Saccharobesus litoralis TaxID=2172099 RepID=A0A2S0VUZ2_9ALTE|nr:alpha/beta fold hydrolase [Saccharobesus litoralis]AWB68041.1 alpha/beta hydrolase [Saccharobesus litoralis]
MILNFTDKGQGPTLVLIHGLLGSLDNLNMVARSLSKHYRVISVDLRNHGASAHDAAMDYHTLASDVFETLDSLQVTNFYLLGHSMGGKAAMVMAIQQPCRINKLVVADIAPVTYPERHQQIFNGLKAIDLDTINNRNDADVTLAKYVDEPGVRQFLLRNLSRQAESFVWKMHLEYIINNYSYVIGFPELEAEYTHPTLFIKGGESDYIQRQHQPAIVKLFPNSKAKIIQGAGHWLHAEKTTLFNRIVSDFLGASSV